jgi:hypothetical protein
MSLCHIKCDVTQQNEPPTKISNITNIFVYTGMLQTAENIGYWNHVATLKIITEIVSCLPVYSNAE